MKELLFETTEKVIDMVFSEYLSLNTGKVDTYEYYKNLNYGILFDGLPKEEVDDYFNHGCPDTLLESIFTKFMINFSLMSDEEKIYKYFRLFELIREDEERCE